MKYQLCRAVQHGEGCASYLFAGARRLETLRYPPIRNVLKRYFAGDQALAQLEAELPSHDLCRSRL